MFEYYLSTIINSINSVLSGFKLRLFWKTKSNIIILRTHPYSLNDRVNLKHSNLKAYLLILCSKTDSNLIINLEFSFWVWFISNKNNNVNYKKKEEDMYEEINTTKILQQIFAKS